MEEGAQTLQEWYDQLSIAREDVTAFSIICISYDNSRLGLKMLMKPILLLVNFKLSVIYFF